MISYFLFYFLLHALKISPGEINNQNNHTVLCELIDKTDKEKTISISVPAKNKILKSIMNNENLDPNFKFEHYPLNMSLGQWQTLNYCYDENDLGKISSQQILEAIIAANKFDTTQPIKEEESSVMDVLLEKAHKKLTLVDFKNVNFVPEELKKLYNNLISFNNFYYSAKATETESMNEYDLGKLLRFIFTDGTRRYTINIFNNIDEPKFSKSLLNLLIGAILYGGYKSSNQPACMSIFSTWFIFEEFIPLVKILCTNYSRDRFYRISKNYSYYFTYEYPFYYQDIGYDEKTNISTFFFQREEPKNTLDDGVWEEFYIDGKIKIGFESEDLLCLNYIKKNNEFWCYDVKKEKHIQLPNGYLVYATLDSSVYILLKLQTYDDDFFKPKQEVRDLTCFLTDYNHNKPEVSEIVFAREHNGKIVEIKSLIISKEGGFANILFAKNHQRLVVIEPGGKMIDYNLSLHCKEKRNIDALISMVEDKKEFFPLQRKMLFFVVFSFLYVFFSNKIERRKQHQVLYQVFLDTIKNGNWSIFTKAVQRIIRGSYAKMPQGSDCTFIRRISCKNEEKLNKKLALYFY